ncbi:MAG: ABC transporter ATP-binding protein [Eubacteriales bacterium]|nr:ABC transporter ATP-binding protein [Eubacteriales bacterium]
MLEVKDLTIRYGNFTAVEGLSFSVEEGQWLMLVGPNGAGKSTVLSAIAQTTPYSGEIYFQGEPLRSMKSDLRASRIGILAQNHFVGYSFSVEEVIRLGRYSHTRGFLAEKRTDNEAAVAQALELTGMTGQRHQSVLTLSGGELQRTFLAQVLAQDPQLLLLDEPTNHLDLVYQKQVFSLIREWLQRPERAVISVVHDLSLAKAYGSHAILLDRGRTVSSGRLKEVMTAEHLNQVYRMDVAEWMKKLLSEWDRTASR